MLNAIFVRDLEGVICVPSRAANSGQSWDSVSTKRAAWRFNLEDDAQMVMKSTPVHRSEVINSLWVECGGGERGGTLVAVILCRESQEVRGDPLLAIKCRAWDRDTIRTVGSTWACGDRILPCVDIGLDYLVEKRSWASVTELATMQSEEREIYV